MVATCHIVAKHVNTLSWISGSKIGRVGTCRGSPDTLQRCHMSRKPWHLVALSLVAEALTHCRVGTCRRSPDTLLPCHLSRKPWHIVALAHVTEALTLFALSLVAEALTHYRVGTCHGSPDTLSRCHLSLSCSEKLVACPALDLLSALAILLQRPWNLTDIVVSGMLKEIRYLWSISNQFFRDWCGRWGDNT